MPAEKSPEKSPDAARTPAEQEPYIPKPPTREQLKEISQDQALITDEWVGEEPGGR